MQAVTGFSLEKLSPRSGNSVLTRKRFEFVTLAIGRYRLRVCDIAALLSKHLDSVAKWFNKGLCLNRDDAGLKGRLALLDTAISERS
jgi:hypothetical protein